MSDVEAAGFVVSFTNAYVALARRTLLGKGETLLCGLLEALPHDSKPAMCCLCTRMESRRRKTQNANCADGSGSKPYCALDRGYTPPRSHLPWKLAANELEC